MPRKKKQNDLIPQAAIAEIFEKLARDMRISSDEMEAILERHNVKKDTRTLRRSYRRSAGQRLMASVRDEDGVREIMAAYNKELKCWEYLVIDACNDPNKLASISKQLSESIAGLERSEEKVRQRQYFIGTFQGYGYRRRTRRHREDD